MVNLLLRESLWLVMTLKMLLTKTLSQLHILTDLILYRRNLHQTQLLATVYTHPQSNYNLLKKGTNNHRTNLTHNGLWDFVDDLKTW